MIKVLHVYKTFNKLIAGGVEQFIKQLITTKNNPDFNYVVLSLAKKSELESTTPPKINHIFADKNAENKLKTIVYKENLNIASNSVSLSLLLDFKKIAEQADVIHYHFPWPFADLLHVFHTIKKPTIVTYHSDIVRQKKLFYFYKPLMNYFLKSVDKIVTTSPNYLATSPILQQYKHKTSVIPIGLNQQNYPIPNPEKLNFWRQKFGEKFFLFVGVLRYYKGLHILLEAAANTTFPIIIVGSGPEEASLKLQAKQLNLTHVHFLGFLDEEDKTTLLQLCFAVIFPSHLRSEAFGISLLEGAMFGKPLISTEIDTGTSYINIANKTGLIIPPNDPQALKQALSYLWDNPEQASIMGKQAVARYHKLFTATQMVDAYEKLYRELLNSYEKK